MTQPSAAGLLETAIERTTPHLDRSIRAVLRIQSLWAAVATTADMNAATSDVLEIEFLKLAQQTGLIADLGTHGIADVKHVIRWALVDRNPFI
jgi:hypothetical protein